MKKTTSWGNFKIASPYDDTPDAEVADEDEVSLVANTGQVPRFNPNLPYAEIAVKFTGEDQMLLEVIKKAIGNGWEGWRVRVNDATTIGLEAEQLVKEMKKLNADVKGLLFDADFAKFARYDIIDLARSVQNNESIWNVVKSN